MANEDTIATVRSLIAESLGVSEDEIVPGASFIEDLGADSLDIVELVMAIEKTFDIEIPDEDAERIAEISGEIAQLQEDVESKDKELTAIEE